MCIAFNDSVVSKMRKSLNSACFVQVNHLSVSKSYEETLGELTLVGAKRVWVGAKRLWVGTKQLWVGVKWLWIGIKHLWVGTKQLWVRTKWLWAEAKWLYVGAKQIGVKRAWSKATVIRKIRFSKYLLLRGKCLQWTCCLLAFYTMKPGLATIRNVCKHSKKICPCSFFHSFTLRRLF